MTGRTHDLAAFTALTVFLALYPVPEMTLATGLVAFSANMIGGLAPDIDQPTAALWHRMRAGGILGKIIHPFLGGHRYISHSLIGIFLFGFVAKIILTAMSSFLIVDMQVVWWSFMLGYVSHMIMDTFTTEGVPWLFPIPIKLGIPPFRFSRIKTGGVVEKSFVFPGLLLLNAYLVYAYYHKFLEVLHQIKR